MNKLVSKNPVLRFKLGKLILKMLKAGKIKAPLRINIGEYTRIRTPDGKLAWTSDPTNTYGNLTQDKIIADKTGQRWIIHPDGRRTFIKLTTSVIKNDGTPKDKGNSGRVITSKRPLKTKEQWESEFNNAKNLLTAQQLMYLDLLNIDTSSAEKMQKSINAYNKDSKLAVDNKWGNKSSTALSRILSSMPTDYRNEDTLYGLNNEKNIPNIVPTKSTTPQTAANFGYRTNNTYENNDFSDRLKNMGIRSNADLIDFGWRTLGNDYDWKGDNWAKQFRSDINLALGGDWSDANIRKIFNTSGNWGRGFLGRGDVGDLQNVLLINAGAWNGLYDKKQQEDLSSRTGLNGTVYSSSHIRDLFDKPLSKYPLFENLLTNITNAPLGIKTPEYANWKTLLNNRLSYYKQGGQLVSRNPILRFKTLKKK